MKELLVAIPENAVLVIDAIAPVTVVYGTSSR
jgi:hypothetical protein